MTEIRERLFIGNLQEAADKDLIELAGINAIVSVARELSTPLIYTFPVYRYSLVDEFLWSNDANTDWDVYEAVEMAAQLHREGKRVLIHCIMGLNRSVLVACGAVIRLGLGERVEGVLGEVRSLRRTRTSEALKSRVKRLYDQNLDVTKPRSTVGDYANDYIASSYQV